MEKASLAFCPGHISGYFRAVQGATPEVTGSMGAGIVINHGVTARVARSPTTNVDIYRADASGNVLQALSGSPPVEYLLNSLGITATVITRCELPISAGYGLSIFLVLGLLWRAAKRRSTMTDRQPPGADRSQF